MRTVQDLYKDVISTEHGRRLFAEARERIIETVAEDAEYPEKVPATFDSIIGKLARKKPYPPSRDIIISYIASDSDGDWHMCLPLFVRDSIADMGIIKPWEHINTDYEPELAEGESSFWAMDDNTIITKLACIRLLPYCYYWDNMSMDKVLGAYVFPGHTADIFFLEELLLRCLYVKAQDYQIYDSPLKYVANMEIPMPTKLAEECDYIDEDFRDKESANIRKTQLFSFLNMYQAMKNARQELIKTDRNTPDAIEEMVIERNSIRCMRCNEEIESTHVHHFLTCSCGACSVDGGKEYLRRVCANDICWIDTSIIRSRIDLD